MESLVLSAFSNPARIKLLCCLSKNKKNVLELTKVCKLSQSSVSQHLSKLKNAGLVKETKQGRFVYYALGDKKTGKVANLLMSFCK